MDRSASSHPAPPAWDLTDAQAACLQVRDALRSLGAQPDLVRGVVPRSDLGDRGYVHVPSLPVELALHVAAVLMSAVRGQYGARR